jgi:DNA-binding CsgD family transcriptional regulator
MEKTGDFKISKGSLRIDDVSSRRRRMLSLFSVIIGSSLLWAWGYVCYLSPVLFPNPSQDQASIGIEYGFFVSQFCVVLFAAVSLLLLRRRRMVIRVGILLAAAVIVSLSSLGLFWSLRTGAFWLVLLCGALDGFCVPMLGVAWGARYSVGTKTMRPLVVLSFVLAYLLYLIFDALPQFVVLPLLVAMPLLSWLIWFIDAKGRHTRSHDVLPWKVGEINAPAEREIASAPAALCGARVLPVLRNPHEQASTTEHSHSELAAGDWRASLLPWRSLLVIMVAALAGNLVSSVVLGSGYRNADGLYLGGAFVCILIAFMSLVPLHSGGGMLSVTSVYRISVGVTAVGLVLLMLSLDTLAYAGALVQGSAFFFQLLVFLAVTQSTQEHGISPLIAFSVGQALIAGVVFFGNVVGKPLALAFGSGASSVGVVCGIALLVLIFMLIGQTNRLDDGLPNDASSKRTRAASAAGEGSPSISAVDVADVADAIDVVSPFDVREFSRLVEFGAKHGFTQREMEVFDLLSKGRSLPYIADVLFITTGTVKTHTVHIYRKLGVGTRQQLLDVYEDFEV